MNDKEAMAMALEALTYKKWWRVGLGEPKDPKLEAAITALRERLAQPEQEKALQALHNENERLGLYKDAYAEQEPVAHLWECLGRWSAYLVDNGVQADCAPPSWLVDAVKNATTPPQRTEQNFCSRCGKRTPDLITIHTCTPPPQEDT
jgi:hypothetical protein